MSREHTPNVVYLNQFPRANICPSVSSFCLKIETWLRMADITYENEDNGMLGRSKKGLSPFVTINGRQIADSYFIIKELTKMFNVDRMEPKTDDEFVCSVALTRLLDLSQHWLLVLHRLTDPPRIHFGPMKASMGFKRHFIPIVSWIFKRKMRGKLQAQGYGAFNEQELQTIAAENLRALSLSLGDKKYFLDDRVTTLDATAFGILAQFWFTRADDEFFEKQYMRDHCPNIVSYLERIKHEFWPDWDLIITELRMDTDWKKAREEKK